MDCEDSRYQPIIPEDEKERNWRKLIEAIKHIETGQRIGEDWIYEQKEFLEKIRERFWDFNLMCPHIQTKEFRKLCSDTETLMRYIAAVGFNVTTYLKILQHLDKINDITLKDGAFNVQPQNASTQIDEAAFNEQLEDITKKLNRM